MRIAVISDIHGNLEAFQAVLADMEHSRVEAAVCLGDNIGYGPEPEEVVRLVRERNIPCVIGNHELALIEGRVLARFNPRAKESLLLSRRLLSAETMRFIDSLPATRIFHEALFVHGCPPDSVTRYLFEVSDGELAAIFSDMAQSMCFVGHTHDLGMIRFDGRTVRRAVLGKGLVRLEDECRHIVNVGSVGQPRDGDNNAKYVIWDTGPSVVDVRFVAYDIAVTARRILALGFPEYNARRLW
jgi:predicted phosphodiesterase